MGYFCHTKNIVQLDTHSLHIPPFLSAFSGSFDTISLATLTYLMRKREGYDDFSLLVSSHIKQA